MNIPQSEIRIILPPDPFSPQMSLRSLSFDAFLKINIISLRALRSQR